MFASKSHFFEYISLYLGGPFLVGGLKDGSLLFDTITVDKVPLGRRSEWTYALKNGIR